MNRALLAAGFTACLAAGGADLWALNEWALPELDRGVALASAPPLSADPVSARATPGALPVQRAREERPPSRPEPAVTVYFPAATHRVNHEAARRLTRALPVLRGAAHLVVVGHADATGPAELNEALSAERARAVARALVHAGLPRDRVLVRWCGEREPGSAGDDRRVEVYVERAP